MPQAADRSLRQPAEPYPGLRPFLAHEAALLFGRDRQVREVIEHLRETQFVAILGGSGSGKSSLIHAGVTPELRSFGIPGAGDFWLTMSCTPGTNVALQAGQQARYTPVTRLAWRFAGLLKSRGSEDADRARLDEIAAVLRQEAGFARLLDRYADELAVPAAFRGDEARLLFVLDQFEEIFHPSNDGVEDAKLLVERVIDHFFSPHPHVYIVLTMRSEHLNDCATFLELPDAINRASYMVRRLGPDELREAVTGPAQRFLRLKARAEPGGRWPEAVVFDETVLERLLADTHAITHDPDHLPLMQHLLARLWKQACQREGGAAAPVAVPAAITPDDLRRAVNAGRDDLLKPGVNVLRASLEAWADAAWRRRPPEQQRQLDALLRRMAYKDPNTGMFTQQRVNVDDAPLILGPGATRETLHALIREDFLGAVDYFFWDDDDSTRVTLKVSHESMIRGWAHFRALIDREGDRFQDFLDALAKCQEWLDSQRSDGRLLERNDLRRLDEAGLDATLARPDEHAQWQRLLKLDRLGQRLLRVEGEFAGFLARSRAAQKVQHDRKRLTWGGLVLLGVALLLFAPYVGFSMLIQTPVAKRALLYYDAGVLANGTQPMTGLRPEEAHQVYRRLIQAAQLAEAGRIGIGVRHAGTADALVRHLGGRLDSVRRQGELLRSVAALVDPPVNGRLRDAIDGYLWNTVLDPRAAIFTPYEPIPMMRCDLGRGPVSGIVLRGSLGSGAAARYIFVPDVAEAGTSTLTLVPLVVTAKAGLTCDRARPVLSIPLSLNPKVVLDSTLRYVFFTQDMPGADGVERSVTMYELDWDSTQAGRDDTLHSAAYLGRRDRAVVVDPKLAQAVDASAGDKAINTVESWRIGSRRIFRFGREVWQIGSGAAQRQPRVDVARMTREAAWAAPGSPCEELRRLGRLDLSYVFDAGEHCILTDLDDGGSAQGATQVRVVVYQRPGAAALRRLAQDPVLNAPVPIATLNRFARIPATSEGSRAPEAWRVGVAEDYEGWLVFRVEAPSGGDLVEIGAPWSTCALAREAAAMIGMRGNPCDPSEIGKVLEARP